MGLENVGPFKPGERVRAGWLQRMLDALRPLTNIRALAPLAVQTTPGGILLSIQPQAATATADNPQWLVYRTPNLSAETLTAAGTISTYIFNMSVPSPGSVIDIQFAGSVNHGGIGNIIFSLQINGAASSTYDLTWPLGPFVSAFRASFKLTTYDFNLGTKTWRFSEDATILGTSLGGAATPQGVTETGVVSAAAAGNFTSGTGTIVVSFAPNGGGSLSITDFKAFISTPPAGTPTKP